MPEPRRRFFWGCIALWFMRRHYAREAWPHAKALGYTFADFRAAAHKALDRELDAINATCAGGDDA